MRFEHTVAELAALLGGQVEGSAERRLTGLASLDRAGQDELAAAFRGPAERQDESRAGCLIVASDSPLAAGEARSLVRVADPEAALDQVAAAWGPPPLAAAPGVHPAAIVEEGACVDPSVAVGPWVFVSRGAKVGARTQLLPGVFLGADAVVGDDCILHPRVYLGARCRLGDRVVIHPGAVLGADGFGYRPDGDGHFHKSPQIGVVVVGDDVEIGANATIDRARLEATVIGSGTKIDDLVHVAHNCTVGENCAFAAQVGVAGSATIGDRVLLGGQVGVGDGRTVGKLARIGGGSAVMRDVPEGAYFIGYPAVPGTEWKRQILSLTRLPDLIAEQRSNRASVSGGEDQRGA